MMRALRPAAKNSLLFVIAIMFTACSNPARVQRDYVAMRDQCRAYAESQEGQYMGQGQQIDDRGRGAVLASIFSDCMYEMGWTVATPPREGGGDGGGGIIDTAREKPQQTATPGTAPDVGNVTLQPSPLPMSPTERGSGSQPSAYQSTQFPSSNYQAIPTPQSVDKKARTGGVAVVTPKKTSPTTRTIEMKKPAPATPAAPAGDLSPDEKKSILDNLNNPD